jgi:hypothetical protein
MWPQLCFVWTFIAAETFKNKIDIYVVAYSDSS